MRIVFNYFRLGPNADREYVLEYDGTGPRTTPVRDSDLTQCITRELEKATGAPQRVAKLAAVEITEMARAQGKAEIPCVGVLRVTSEGTCDEDGEPAVARCIRCGDLVCGDHYDEYTGLCGYCMEDGD